MLTDKHTRSMAIMATKHCLIGCGIGEILGVIIGTALNWSDFSTIALAVGLAFMFGYSFTFFPLISKVGAKKAASTALAADTVSITSMEIIDNLVLVVIPGAMAKTVVEPLFWLSLALALAVAFIVTVPVNYWMIGRGKGHAVVHEHHDHANHHGHH